MSEQIRINANYKISINPTAKGWETIKRKIKESYFEFYDDEGLENILLSRITKDGRYQMVMWEMIRDHSEMFHISSDELQDASIIVEKQF